MTTWQDRFAKLRYGQAGMDEMLIMGTDHPHVREFFAALAALKPRP